MLPMKIRFLAWMTAGLACLVLAGCVVEAPPGGYYPVPGGAAVVPPPVSPGYGGGGYYQGGGYQGGGYAARSPYQVGMDYGLQDRRDGRSANPDRYRNRVPERDYPRYVEGYAQGYGRGYTPPVGYSDEKFGKETYENGRRRGRDDARNERSNNFRRHRDAYKPKFEDSFRLGYEQGYKEGSREGSWGGGGGGHGGGWDAAQREAYRRGFNAGDRDLRRGASPDYQRHDDEYSSRTERSFGLGYGDGYARRRSAY